MATNYVIGVGGTGAKCVEALIHSCAVGLGPSDVFVILVDPDKANGNGERTREAYNAYAECREALGLGPDDVFFKTELTCADKNQNNLLWSPVKAKSFSSHFRYPLLSSEAKALCNLLYTEEQLDQDLNWGFRGHPSIGAPLMAHLPERESPWFEFFRDITARIGNGQVVRVFVFASIFGGTGASAFPTLGRIFKNKFALESNFQLGGCLVLPYFTYDIPPEALANQQLFADHANFLLNTKAALHFYDQMKSLDATTYKSIYFLGDNTPFNVKQFALGSARQKNPSHVIEVLGALAAIDWYDNAAGGRPYSFLGAHDEILYWSDMPNGKAVEDRLLTFTSFVESYEKLYSPLLKEKEKMESYRNRMPWYVNNFEAGALTDENARKAKVKFDDYVNCYKQWLVSAFEADYVPDRHVKLLSLVDGLAKVKYWDEKDQKGGCNYEPKIKAPYDSLWNLMCRGRTSTSAGTKSAFGKFVSMLQKASVEFCDKNYGGKK